MHGVLLLRHYSSHGPPREVFLVCTVSTFDNTCFLLIRNEFYPAQILRRYTAPGALPTPRTQYSYSAVTPAMTGREVLLLRLAGTLDIAFPNKIGRASTPRSFHGAFTAPGAFPTPRTESSYSAFTPAMTRRGKRSYLRLAGIIENTCSRRVADFGDATSLGLEHVVHDRTREYVLSVMEGPRWLARTTE